MSTQTIPTHLPDCQACEGVGTLEVPQYAFGDVLYWDHICPECDGTGVDVDSFIEWLLVTDRLSAPVDCNDPDLKEVA